jgi:hypothetical protein
VGGLGETGLTDPARLRAGFPVVMGLCAGLLAAGGLLSAVVLRPPGARGGPGGLRATTHP